MKSLFVDSNIRHATAVIPIQIALTSLKGRKSIAPMSLKTSPIVKPTILNGKRINQIIGNKNNMTSARGQQIASNRNQRTIAINVFMDIWMTRPHQIKSQFNNLLI
jgi:hypothetical protein